MRSLIRAAGARRWRLPAALAAGALALAGGWLGLVAAPALAGTGSISGKVTAAAGQQPLAGVEVCAVTAAILTPEFEKELEEGVEPGSEQIGCTLTGAGDEYTVSGLAAGDFLVGFGNPFLGSLNYITQYYKGKPSLEEASPVTVTSGSTTSGIDAELQEGAELSGTITSATTGAPVEGAFVCAMPTPRPTTREGGCARSTASGTYAVVGLEAGGYMVGAFAPGFAGAFYGGAGAPSEASTVTLAAKEARGAINIALSPETAPLGAPGEKTGTGLPGENGASTHPTSTASGVGLANAFVQEHTRRSVFVRLTCNSPQRCRGEVSLTATRHLKRAGRRITKTVAIGSAHFTGRSEHSFAVKVRLTRVGRTLLGGVHGNLAANLRIVQMAPLPSQTTVKRVLLIGEHAARPKR